LAEGLVDPEPDASVQALVDLRLVDAYVAAELGPEADRERLRLHPLVRAYAGELLNVEGPIRRDMAQLAVAFWYADYAPEAYEFYAALALDEANIIGAREWVHEQAVGGEGGDDIIAGICHGMRGFWRDTDRTRYGLAYLPWGIEAAERIATRTGAQENWLEAVNIVAYHGALLQLVGRTAEAEEAFLRGLALRRKVGDRPGEGVDLYSLGTLALERGRLDEAQAYLEQSLSIAREEEDRHGEATILNDLGNMALQRLQLDEARSYLEESLTLRTETGNRLREGATLSNLGGLAMLGGQLEEAEAYFEESLAIARETGDRDGEGITMNDLGDVALSRGRLEEAQRHYESALTILPEVGHRRVEGITLSNLGQLAQDRGSPDEAQAYYEQALAIAREVQDLLGESNRLTALGNLAQDQEHWEDAEHYFRAALDRDLGNPRKVAVDLIDLADVLEAQGHRSEAEVHLNESLAIFREAGNGVGESSLLATLGRWARDLERWDDAEGYIREALAIDWDLDHTDAVCIDLNDLAAVLDVQGRHEEAEAARQEARTLEAAAEQDTPEEDKQGEGEGTD
jgi:tetratricopeptide (TPR) repeat protein